MSRDLAPKQIVAFLDRFIVGQGEAKKVIANSLRYKWRRQQVPKEMKSEIVPKNILMQGPTGVGKTETLKRIAILYNAPFIKTEATRFTEIGYVGKDVESIIRDLVEISVNLVKKKMHETVRQQAHDNAESRVIDYLVGEDAQESTRERIRQDLRNNLLDNETIEIEVTDSKMNPGVDMAGFPGGQIGMINVGDMIGKVLGKNKKKKKVTVAESYELLMEEEAEKIIDEDKAIREGIKNAEEEGIVFIDEIDKLITSTESKMKDVSREGVQRDLLPLIEGTTVVTKYGNVKTDHILFIASGAFYDVKPDALLPELQGRLPVRVVLNPLTRDDMIRILKEPEYSLIKQYIELFKVEDIELQFEDSAIERIADIALTVNSNIENTGARRLHTILEKLLEDLSFDSGESKSKVVIDTSYVNDKLKNVVSVMDLSKFIL